MVKKHARILFTLDRYSMGTSREESTKFHSLLNNLSRGGCASKTSFDAEMENDPNAPAPLSLALCYYFEEKRKYKRQ